MPATQLEVVREHERYRITGISRTQWWRLEKAGQVPRRIRLSKNSVGWFRHELEAMLCDRAGREVA